MGGSPIPSALIRLWEKHYDVGIIHFWSMAETSPIGTVARFPYGTSSETRERHRVSQRRSSDIMQFHAVDDNDRVFDLHDHNQGELQVCNNVVTEGHYGSPEVQGGGTAHFFRGTEVGKANEQFTEDR